MAKDNAEKPATKYTKEQILRSVRYQNRRDLIGALLVNEHTYTHAEVGKIISDYMKGKVI